MQLLSRPCFPARQRPVSSADHLPRAHAKEDTKHCGTSHRLGLSNSLSERLGAGSRYANALTDAKCARRNADWKCPRVEVLVRFLSAGNGEEAASVTALGARATNALIAISGRDCNLWPGTVPEFDSVPGRGE